MFNKKTIRDLLLKIALHILFWSVVLFFFTYFFGAGSEDYDDTLQFSLFLMPITIATTYVSIYKLIPDYFITKRYFHFTLYSLYTLIISGYLIMVSIFFSLTYLANFQYGEMNPITRNILFVTTAVYSVTLVASAFKLLKLNVKHTEQTKRLETQILETQLKLKEQELNYLKMQIQPHFLFNTLNTMYGFALKKADETPEMILKLSNLLDYLLYEVDKPLVPLIKEINHVRDYINLEQIRFSDRLVIDFKCDSIPETITIAPMLLLPFIENSFKHGHINNGKLLVHINLNLEPNVIHFNITNSSIKKDGEDNKQGIGLQNVKKRLDLLYPNQYNLDIKQQDSLFKVDLKLFTND